LFSFQPLGCVFFQPFRLACKHDTRVWSTPLLVGILQLLSCKISGGVCAIPRPNFVIRADFLPGTNLVADWVS